MREYIKREIINALILIQDVCREVEGCEVCPFGNDNDCMFQKDGNIPETWKIDRPVEEVWRAFK